MSHANETVSIHRCVHSVSVLFEYTRFTRFDAATAGLADRLPPLRLSMPLAPHLALARMHDMDAPEKQ